MPTNLDTVEANARNSSPFDFEEVQLQFQLESEICKLLVRNNYVYIILKAGTIHIINLDDPEIVKNIVIPLPDKSELKNAWIDKHRYHLILQSSKTEYYYVNHHASNYHQLSKLKNIPITSISFFEDCVTKHYTGPLLISTSNSLLLEYSINCNKETLLKTIMKNKFCFTDISNCRISQDDGVLTYSINLFTNDNQLFNLRTKIPSNPSSNVSVFQGLAKFDPFILKQGKITNISSDHQYLAYVENISSHSKLYLIRSDVDHPDASEPSLINLGKLKVKTFLLTKYFILVLTNDNCLEIFNQLNLEHLKSIKLSNLDKKMKGIQFDELSKTFWLYSDKHLYELIVDFQTSGIFNTMVDKNMFEDALDLLEDNTSPKVIQKRNFVLKRKGYYLLDKMKNKEAVELLAKTDESFNKVALRIFDLPDKSILRYYLTLKLKNFPNSMKAQRALLSSWIVEIFMEQMNSQDNMTVHNYTNEKSTIVDNGNDTNDTLVMENGSRKSETLQKELYLFFEEQKNTFDIQTIYQIMISHNRNEDLLYFANLMNDYHFVLKYYISLQRWDDALKVLSAQQDPGLVYKCATVLLVNHPTKTIDTWIRLIDDLNTLHLVPALLTYNNTMVTPQNIKPQHNQSLRFLRFLIYEKKVSNKIIHNTFFSILISYPSLSNENIILKELESYQKIKKKSFGKFDRGEPTFDYDFILRLTFKFHKIQSAIYIYSILNKNEEAVTLALDNDLIDAAILVADKPGDSDEYQRKHLWLKISEKLIGKVVTNKDYVKQNQKMFFGDNNISEKDHDPIYVLFKFLTEKCDELTVKDLLPLFPEFIVIDNFKDILVESLKKLSLDMNRTALEMGNTLHESDKINKKIEDFKTTSFQIIEPFESCQICHKILAIRKFIVFPCGHSFHQDCLVKSILESNDYKAKNSIYKLQKKILMNNKNKAVIEELKLEIDQLLSKSCPLCSEMKINEIDEPLIKAGDKETKEWDI